jgi:hypothetical protein
MLIYFIVSCCLPLIGLRSGLIVLSPRATPHPIAYSRG